ncbi:hypothetical protein OLX02_04210 [Novosphingobium sp. KCTC 2891]|nr:hypothetical protein [Novosphingobium sp. KCTC 2891]
MAFDAFDMGDEAHATGVMLITRIIQALNRRKSHLEGVPTSIKWKRRANRAPGKGTKVARISPMTAGKLFCNREK